MQRGPTGTWQSSIAGGRRELHPRRTERLGIVREVTGRAREQVYVYGGYLDLLARVGGGE